MKLIYPPKKLNRLGVAVSGGADSVALLLLLIKEQERFADTLVVYTVDHGIRKEGGKKDVAFVQDLCSRLGVECHAHAADVPAYAKAHKLGLEEAARVVRYAFLEEAIAKGEVDAVATAHHAEDAAETVLFRLLRGCGLSGVSGVLLGRKGFIRPLLSATKTDLLCYLSSQNQPYVCDETNDCTDFSRNFLRKEIFPALGAYFPKAKEHLAAFSLAAGEDEALLLSLAAPFVNKNVVLPCKERPLFFRALISAMRAAGLTADYERAHLESAYALQRKPVGKKEELPHGYFLEKTREGVAVCAPPAPYFETPFCEGEIDLPCGKFLVERVSLGKEEAARLAKNLKQSSSFAFYLDAESLANPLAPRKAKSSAHLSNAQENTPLQERALLHGAVFRQRKKGDVFQPFGHSTEKRLKDFFVSKKLTSDQKDRAALLVLQGETKTENKSEKEEIQNGKTKGESCGDLVCAVLPYGVAEWAKITPKTRLAIRITLLNSAPF